MYPVDLRTRLAASLDPDPAPRPGPGDRLAGVLLPLLRGSEPSLVFTRRTEELSRHPGEISFPGGLEHAGDANLKGTALRETEEELGLPASLIEVLGALEPVHTTVSAILIVPFVGLLEGRPSFVPNASEIADVQEFTLAGLMAAEERVEWPIGDHVYRGYAYEMETGTIWGATAQILHGLLEILRPGSS